MVSDAGAPGGRQSAGSVGGTVFGGGGGGANGAAAAGLWLQQQQGIHQVSNFAGHYDMLLIIENFEGIWPQVALITLPGFLCLWLASFRNLLTPFFLQ